MKLSGRILKFIRNYIKFSKLVYHTQSLRNKLLSEHVLFVPVFAGPVTIFDARVYYYLHSSIQEETLYLMMLPNLDHCDFAHKK